MRISVRLLAHVDSWSTGIFENILGFNPQLSTQLVEKTSLLPWLLNRIQLKTHDENRGYAAELLSILLQDNSKNRLEFGKQDGVEALLKVLSVSYGEETSRTFFNDVVSNIDGGTPPTLMN